MIDGSAAWEKTIFGEQFKVCYGKASPRADRSPDGPVPVVGSAGQMAYTNSPLVSEPCLVIGRKGNVGQTHLMMNGSWPTDTTYYVLMRDDIDPKFLQHQLISRDLRRLDSSTATPSLRRQDLESVPLTKPPLEEQRRIVEILEDHLSRLDAAADYASAAERRLSRLRDQLVRDAITGAVAGGDRRAPDLAAAGTVDGDLPTLPGDWRWKRLGDIADVAGGVTKDAKKQSDPSFVSVPYLRVANVQRGALHLEDVTSIRVSSVKADALRLQRGDVLLNEGGDRDKLARGWVWEEQIENCIHQNHVFRARPHDEIDPYFLSWCANTIGGRWAERNGKQSVNLASISLSMIRKMPVIVPPIEAARLVVAQLHDRLHDLDAMAASIADSQARTSALRRAVLAAAFSGKLTGRNTDCEVIEEIAG